MEFAFSFLVRLFHPLQHAGLSRRTGKQNLELERGNQLKNQFLGMVAHDLRNPVATILFHSDLLCDHGGAGLTGEQHGFLSSIQKSSEFILRMVDDLLDISSIEAGILRLDRHPSDLHKLLEHHVSRSSSRHR